MVRPRAELALFQTAVPTGGPDYAPAEVMADVDDILPPRVASIHHAQIMMPPGGEAQARRFYGELLGMAEIEKPAPLRARGGLWMQAGDRRCTSASRRPASTAPRRAPTSPTRSPSSTRGG